MKEYCNPVSIIGFIIAAIAICCVMVSLCLAGADERKMILFRYTVRYRFSVIINKLKEMIVAENGKIANLIAVVAFIIVAVIALSSCISQPAPVYGVTPTIDNNQNRNNGFCLTQAEEVKTIPLTPKTATEALVRFGIEALFALAILIVLAFGMLGPFIEAEVKWRWRKLFREQQKQSST